MLLRFSIYISSGVCKIFQRGWGAYDYNQICLIEEYIQMEEKNLHFESVLDFIIFSPK